MTAKGDKKFGNEFLPEILAWIADFYGTREGTIPYSTDFDQEEFGIYFLQDILDWIVSNVQIDEVFPDDAIIDWYETEFGGRL